MDANISPNAELKLYTQSKQFNSNPKKDGHFKRYGVERNRHGIPGPHVHQPKRNVNPFTGVITGTQGSNTKNGGVGKPNKKDMKQLYEFLVNGKYHI